MMTHDEFEASAKKFCDEFNARLAATQDRNEIEALRKTFRRHMDEVRKLLAALAEGAMQRLTDTQDWNEIKALRESLREHMAEIHRLRAALAETAMQRLTDVHQEMEETHTSVDNEYTPVKPVAWRTKNATPPGGYVVFQQYPSAVANLGGEIEPLYTAPPKRKPLMDEEITRLWVEAEPGPEAFARAIERAHGIGGGE